MVSLFRVDDRLVHGQITTTWVPYTKADTIVVASDEVAGNKMRRVAIGCCARSGLKIIVKSIDDAIETLTSYELSNANVILIVSGLKDAKRLYDGGMKFNKLNIGNIHHDTGDYCRSVTSSICIDSSDEELIEGFEDLGVEIDLRAVPTSKPLSFKKRG